MRSGASARALGFLVQLALIALVALAIVALWRHAQQALSLQGAKSGFDFLAQSSGFDISESLLPFDSRQPFWRAFLVGLVNTVSAAVPAALLATALGTLLGIGRLAPHRIVRALCAVYVEAIRNVPLLVQMLMLYFALTQLLPDSDSPLALAPGWWLSKAGLTAPWIAFGPGAHLRLLWPERGPYGVSGGAALSPEYLAVMLSLALYSGAFVAEIVRAGIGSVDQGQWLAAKALGMRASDQLRSIILPQALRVIVPALTNQFSSLTKNSSLAVTVGYPELISVTNTSINLTGRAFECIAIAMAVYLALSLLISAGMNRYNARVALKGWS